MKKARGRKSRVRVPLRIYFSLDLRKIAKYTAIRGFLFRGVGVRLQVESDR
jgi:hypothetical protein